MKILASHSWQVYWQIFLREKISQLNLATASLRRQLEIGPMRKKSFRSWCRKNTNRSLGLGLGTISFISDIEVEKVGINLIWSWYFEPWTNNLLSSNLGNALKRNRPHEIFSLETSESVGTRGRERESTLFASNFLSLPPSDYNFFFLDAFLPPSHSSLIHVTQRLQLDLPLERPFLYDARTILPIRWESESCLFFPYACQECLVSFFLFSCLPSHLWFLFY